MKDAKVVESNTLQQSGGFWGSKGGPDLPLELDGAWKVMLEDLFVKAPKLTTTQKPKKTNKPKSQDFLASLPDVSPTLSATIDGIFKRQVKKVAERVQETDGILVTNAASLMVNAVAALRKDNGESAGQSNDTFNILSTTFNILFNDIFPWFRSNPVMLETFESKQATLEPHYKFILDAHKVNKTYASKFSKLGGNILRTISQTLEQVFDLDQRMIGLQTQFDRWSNAFEAMNTELFMSTMRSIAGYGAFLKYGSKLPDKNNGIFAVNMTNLLWVDNNVCNVLVKTNQTDIADLRKEAETLEAVFETAAAETYSELLDDMKSNETLTKQTVNVFSILSGPSDTPLPAFVSPDRWSVFKGDLTKLTENLDVNKKKFEQVGALRSAACEFYGYKDTETGSVFNQLQLLFSRISAEIVKTEALYTSVSKMLNERASNYKGTFTNTPALDEINSMLQKSDSAQKIEKAKVLVDGVTQKLERIADHAVPKELMGSLSELRDIMGDARGSGLRATRAKLNRTSVDVSDVIGADFGTDVKRADELASSILEASDRVLLLVERYNELTDKLEVVEKFDDQAQVENNMKRFVAEYANKSFEEADALLSFAEEATSKLTASNALVNERRRRNVVAATTPGFNKPTAMHEAAQKREEAPANLQEILNNNEVLQRQRLLAYGKDGSSSDEGEFKEEESSAGLNIHSLRARNMRVAALTRRNAARDARGRAVVAAPLSLVASAAVGARPSTPRKPPESDEPFYDAICKNVHSCLMRAVEPRLSSMDPKVVHGGNFTALDAIVSLASE